MARGPRLLHVRIEHVGGLVVRERALARRRRVAALGLAFERRLAALLATALAALVLAAPHVGRCGVVVDFTLGRVLVAVAAGVVASE